MTIVTNECIEEVRRDGREVGVGEGRGEERGKSGEAVEDLPKRGEHIIVAGLFVTPSEVFRGSVSERALL